MTELINYRVAVLGAGKIGAVHLRSAALSKRLTPVAIADSIAEAAAQTAALYGVNDYTDYREMIDKERPDIAVIALPPFLHREAAEFCAERGCHILLEKPMARTSQECDAINLAVKKKGVIMLVGHTMHYLPQNKAAKRLLDSGDFGELLMMNHNWQGYYYNNRLDWFFDKELSGGGIMMNLGSHAIDNVQWFSSSRVSSVHASLQYTGVRGDIEAAGTAMVKTRSGVSSVITLFGLTRIPKNELELLCQGGIIRISPHNGVWVLHNDEVKQVYKPAEEDVYLDQLESLADSIESGIVVECDGEYGKSVIMAVEAIYKSHECGLPFKLREINPSD